MPPDPHRGSRSRARHELSPSPFGPPTFFTLATPLGASGGTWEGGRAAAVVILGGMRVAVEVSRRWVGGGGRRAVVGRWTAAAKEVMVLGIGDDDGQKCGLWRWWWAGGRPRRVLWSSAVGQTCGRRRWLLTHSQRDHRDAYATPTRCRRIGVLASRRCLDNASASRLLRVADVMPSG
jgi:hypothetical protein